MQDKALAMLGMATKAGKVVSGEFSVEKAVKEGKAWLVLVAEDASDRIFRGKGCQRRQGMAGAGCRRCI